MGFRMINDISGAKFSRPYGTEGIVVAHPIPSDKSLGYFQMSLQGTKFRKLR